MIDICLNYSVHQPYRLREFSFDEIGTNERMDYINEKETKKFVRLMAEKNYLPANFMLKKALIRQEKKFKIGIAISGISLELFEKYEPLVISSFKELINTNCVELLAIPYHFSLSGIFSEDEFTKQLELHSQKVQSIFGQKPKVLFNTSLTFNNLVGNRARVTGLKGVITEGVQHILNKQNPNHVFLTRGFDSSLCLLRNNPLSEWLAKDSTNNSPELSVMNFERLLRQEPNNTEIITLALDYSYLSELNNTPQSSPSAIIDFFKILPGYLLNSHEYRFVFPSEALDKKPIGVYDILEAVTWADKSQDLSDWIGNHMQKEVVTKLYQLEKRVNDTSDSAKIEMWRKLQSSENFFYMSTKMLKNINNYHSNPFASPFDAYISYMNILSDFETLLKK
jgi:alpha-amylase